MSRMAGVRTSVAKLQLLFKAEATLAQIRAQRTAFKLVIGCVALVLFLLALASLHFAIFAFFATRIGPAASAVILAGLDVLLGLALLVYAQNGGPRFKDEALAREVREIALAEMAEDLDAIRSDIRNMAGEIRDVSLSVRQVRQGVVDTVGPMLVSAVQARRERNTREKPSTTPE